jgi:hypothetical protein
MKQLTNWESDLKNNRLSDKEKYEKVKEKAKKIEEMAGRKE